MLSIGASKPSGKATSWPSAKEKTTTRGPSHPKSWLTRY